MMLRTLASYDVDGEPLLAAAGLDARASQGGDQRVLATAMQKVWRAAVSATNDESFGLSFAQQLHPAAIQGLGFSCAVSDTLYDAFMRLVRYYRIITSAGEIILEEGDERVRLLYCIPGKRGAAAPASLDAALALFLQLCRITRGDRFDPILVELQRATPNNTQPFDDYFRCPIKYDCTENALCFDLHDLHQPLAMANPELARANDQVIINYLKRHDQSDLINQVRSTIIDSLPSGVPSQESVAQSLNSSPRTLQRKLKALNQTYSELLDTIRSELAQQYLAVPSRNIGEVAYLLGFSEPGNFARSFRKWTGKTPAQFRENH